MHIPGFRDQMVEMDWSTYRALDIFGEDKKKEVGWRKAMSQSFNSGASLFSLMNRCRSSLGKYTLMYVRPLFLIFPFQELVWSTYIK